MELPEWSFTVDVGELIISFDESFLSGFLYRYDTILVLLRSGFVRFFG